MNAEFERWRCQQDWSTYNRIDIAEAAAAWATNRAIKILEAQDIDPAFKARMIAAIKMRNDS